MGGFDLTNQHLRHLVGEPTARFGMMPPFTSLQLVVESVVMCLGIEGLSAKIHNALQRSPIEGATYAFRNQRSNRLKVLLWDRSGVWLAQRRLHHGRYCLYAGCGDVAMVGERC